MKDLRKTLPTDTENILLNGNFRKIFYVIFRIKNCLRLNCRRIKLLKLQARSGFIVHAQFKIFFQLRDPHTHIQIF